MNKTSLLMLIVGTILGVVIGYVTFSAKPVLPEVIIEAEGFREITYSRADKKFDIEIVERVDGNLDVNRKFRIPLEGYTKSLSVMDFLLKDLVARGVLEQSSDAGASSTPTQE